METIYYAYVLDRDQKLLGVVSFRELFSAPGDKSISEVMVTDLVTVSEDTHQEEVARLVSLSDLMAVPVLDHENRMKGIITYDDIVDVIEEEATEDMHKVGGLETLETPYLQASILTMVRKRGIWLAILLLGEMLTTTAMARYQSEIARGRGPDAFHTADHLQWRKFRVPGHHAGHPGHGFGRSKTTRLVAGWFRENFTPACAWGPFWLLSAFSA